MNSAGGIFVGMTIMVLLLKPHVSDGVRNALPDPVPTAEASTPVATPVSAPTPTVVVSPPPAVVQAAPVDNAVATRTLQMLDAILDKLEKQSKVVGPQSRGIDTTLSNRLAVQEIQESTVRYQGEDSVVRDRLNLAPRVADETVTIEEFDKQFDARFGR